MGQFKILVFEDNIQDFKTIHNALTEYLGDTIISPNIPKAEDNTWESFLDKVQNFSSNKFENFLLEVELKDVNLYIVDISLLGGNDDEIGLDFIKYLEKNKNKNENVNYILVSKGSKLKGFKSSWYSDFFSTNFIDKEYEGKYFGKKLIKKIQSIYGK